MKILIIHPAHKDNFHLDLLNQGYCEFIDQLVERGAEQVDIKNLDAEFYGMLEDPKGIPKPPARYNFLEDNLNIDIMLDYLNGQANDDIDGFIGELLAGLNGPYDHIIVVINWHRQILGGLVLAKYLKNSSNKVIFGNIVRHSSYRAVNLAFLRGQYGFIDFLVENGEYKNIIDQLGNPRSDRIPLKEEWLLKRPYRFLCYELDQGCVGKCMFCSNAKTADIEGEGRFDRLSRLKELYEINNKILFMQPAINPTRRYLESFIRYIREHKINIAWTSYAMCKHLDYPILKEMHEIGCRLLEFGVESG